MAKIIINQDRCKGCFLCVNFCPKGLIKKSVKLNKQGLNFVEFDLNGACIGCMQCAVICPDCCIEVDK
ncbi:MAG: 4Fe-4S dicluster domain-containing protein [Candidatus Omnitrophota bacterium]|nr:4Fe-4S dicluster domain-containing protein [Candidatus Omnitrophota bacterium]